MTATIIKSQSTKPNVHNIGSCSFKIKLPVEAEKFLGREIRIKKLETHFELSKFGSISEGNPSTINASGWLTMGSKIVDEWNDLGEYDLDFDSESEVINLIKR